jgi:mannose-6-phosphate isomerase-like protein (cupin superfamily)
MSRTRSLIACSLALTFVAPVVGSDPVKYFSGDDTRAAFAVGKPLTETALYKVHASRREKPGQAEVHERDTDIIYVLDGTATLVTGGSAVGATTTAPDERRGASITGGTTRRLAKGDVIVVPHGTAHQFTEVQAPFLYYVVKVTTGDTR